MNNQSPNLPISQSLSKAAFDAKVESWNADQEAPWGKLRYKIGLANLADWLEKRPLSILDLGGGNGYDAIPLAKLGHHLTIIDFSEEMLKNGAAYAEAHGVSDQLTFIQSEAESFSDKIAGQTFDMVLCHNLLQYLSNPLKSLKQIHDHLTHNGLFSLIIMNPHSETYSQALRNLDFATAFENIGKKTHQTVTFKVNINLYDESELRAMLKTTGFTFQKLYGVRAVCDYIADNDIKHNADEYQKLEALEMLLRDKHPYTLISRFYHFISTKNI
ncbi:MAG: methyltransferase domain-containing protein [Chloroflexota bacterium]